MTTPSASFLIECITIETGTYEALLQDKGVGSGETEYDSMKSRFFKAADNRKYKGVWQLAKLFVEKLKSSVDRFPRYPSKREDSAIIKRIAGIIFTLRNQVDGVYCLDQAPLHTRFASLWGEDNESGGPTMSDKARIFGLVTSDKYKDELNILMGRPSAASENVGTRIDRDDSSLSQRNIWNRIKMDFHDESVIVHNPSNWSDASTIEGYSEIKPNDKQRMSRHQNRDTDFFKKTLFKEVISVYRSACKKYRKDTGNGGGKPENFMDWNKNEDVKFQYFCRGQSAALLTWVFMKDRECHYILEEEKDQIPIDIQIEDSTNFSVVSTSTTRRRSPTSVGKGIEEILKTTQNTMSSLLESVSDNTSQKRDSNMNYHDMAKTLELTSQMQKDFASENANEDYNVESPSAKRRKRLKAALEKIQDGVMDSLDS